ncbi:nascent polypeptide-associated complex subunit alpha, muscle-specific form-like [Tyto alba]|uniref:nascent polypeptide-associated complex subunit alpha, muscle-specific form-like n=1 Tax=Tyto alba TaxID=56313 RepID=UPI001C68346C|nr:nascent polypeptide-associated complex subunit alpha, muscle-specific form-like [Tyto alba]
MRAPPALLKCPSPTAAAGPAPPAGPGSSQGTKEAPRATLAGHKGLAALRPPDPKESRDTAPALPGTATPAPQNRSCWVALEPSPACGQRPRGAPGAFPRRTTKARASEPKAFAAKSGRQKGCPWAVLCPGRSRGRPYSLPWRSSVPAGAGAAPSLPCGLPSRLEPGPLLLSFPGGPVKGRVAAPWPPPAPPPSTAFSSASFPAPPAPQRLLTTGRAAHSPSPNPARAKPSHTRHTHRGPCHSTFPASRLPAHHHACHPPTTAPGTFGATRAPGSPFTFPRHIAREKEGIFSHGPPLGTSCCCVASSASVRPTRGRLLSSPEIPRAPSPIRRRSLDSSDRPPVKGHEPLC